MIALAYEVARSERFELPTLGIEIRCSIQLSYERLRFLDGSVGGPAGPTRHPNQFAFSCPLFKPVGAALTDPWDG
jgi:hypothetical protein